MALLCGTWAEVNRCWKKLQAVLDRYVMTFDGNPTCQRLASDIPVNFLESFLSVTEVELGQISVTVFRCCLNINCRCLSFFTIKVTLLLHFFLQPMLCSESYTNVQCTNCLDIWTHLDKEQFLITSSSSLPPLSSPPATSQRYH